MRHLFQVVWGLDLDGLISKIQSIGRFIAFVVAGSSAAANFLPKYESLIRWPRLQRFYKGFINVIAAFALNIRKRLPTLGMPAPFLGITHDCPDCQAAIEAESNPAPKA